MSTLKPLGLPLTVMLSISILCYFNSHHSCFIYINCSVVAMVLDQKKRLNQETRIQVTVASF